jgi:RHS repeat-associated protein
VAVTGDGTTVAAIYLDGSPVTLTNHNGAINNTTVAGLNIGRRNNDARYFNGVLDELRLSNAQRSADWIKTGYNNQSSPATFFSIASANDGCNEPPVANAGGPYSAESGETIRLDASGSFDPDGNISSDPNGNNLSYQWDFGDGGTCREATCSYAYLTPGTYTVTVTVTDDFGATASATTTATVNGTLQANPGGPYSGAQQTPIQFQGDASSGSITSYQWSFGDGSEGSGVSPTHTYAASGNYSVSLTVTDNSSGSATAYTTANINATPIAIAGGPYSAPPNSSIQFNGTASSDPDGTIAGYQWNFGDGATGSGATPTHSYSAANNYAVTLTVTDNSGGVTTTSVTATICNPDPHISSIQIYPGNVVLKVGGRVQFAAVSRDNNGVLYGGVKYTWQTNYTGQAGGVVVSEAGFFVAEVAGTYNVIVEGGGHLAQVTVTVQNSAAPSCTGNCTENLTTTGDDPYSWNQDNKKWATDPINEVGNPTSRTDVGGASSGSFQLTVPLISLAGRGLDLNLDLAYNSRVWAKTKTGSVTEMTYDIDKGAPAPGWSFGFGKIINMVDGGAMMVDADGTRHGATGGVVPGGQGIARKVFSGFTSDSSFVQYIVYTDYRNDIGSDFAQANYPNGTIIRYVGGLEATGARVLYPASIADANGNYMILTYHRHSQPANFTRAQLETITDTLGRVVLFHYDNNDLLTSITAAGLKDANGNVTTRTLIRIHYKPLTLDYAFAPMTAQVRNGTAPIWVIDALYFPATASGYWFGDPDSYSTYGMINKVEMQRGMGFSTSTATPLNELGTVTPGTMSRRQTYNYPMVKGDNLADAPDYTTLTETWEGGGPAVTHFDVHHDDSPRTVSVTAPDNTRRVQYSYNIPEGTVGHFNDGSMYKDELYDANNHLISRTEIGWNQDVLLHVVAAWRPDFVVKTDERGQTFRTEYTYDTEGATRETREFDYDGSLVRKTVREHTTLGGNGGFLDDHSFNTTRNLLTDEKIFAGNGTLMSHTAYRYDEDPDAYTHNQCYEGNMTNAPGVVMHNNFFDPFGMFGCGISHLFLAPNNRGNLTSVIRYPNVNDETSKIIESRRYDITGNLVSTSSSCCEKASGTYDLANQYAYPISQTRGSSDANSLMTVTKSAEYDFNTGFLLSAKDANGRQTTNSYYVDSLRPKQIVSATGATTKFEYDDLALTVTQTRLTSVNGSTVGQTVKYINGAGQVYREQALTIQGVNVAWDTVDTLYNQFGRLSQQSRPYRIGDPIVWNSTIYDAAGRVYAVLDANYYGQTIIHNAEPPAGASSSPGQTAKTIDAWGRWRWTRSNSSGKLAEVVEPNPAGGPGFVTKYTYDALDQLVKIEQPNQVRRFRYDAMGRLTQQKLAEANATLNAAGELATTEPENERWSDVFTYDKRSNKISHTDARGVKTNFSYKDSNNNEDPLNRIQSVSYDLTRVNTATLTVLPAPTVSYQYRTKTSSSQLVDLSQIRQVVAAGASTEDFDYDIEGRVHEKKLTLAGRPNPMTITYDYDTLGRVSQMTYPEQYKAGVTSPTRKAVTPSFDASGRLAGLKVNGADYASQVSFNPASQIVALTVGASNPLFETYSYEPTAGLPATQKVKRNGVTLMSLSYDYKENYCFAENCTTQVRPSTGQITKVEDEAGIKLYTYDALGRLSGMTSGDVNKTTHTFNVAWAQNYSYDPYGNRTGVTSSGSAGGAPVPRDGRETLSYDLSSNRVTSPGFTYDAAGNQTTADTGQSFIYDAANRLAQVKDQNNITVATYTYGASNHRLSTQTGNESSTTKTYYVWEGDSVITEYTDPSGAAMPQWSKNYIYFGSRLLATQEPIAAGGELVSYHHADRLGTRLVTNNADNSFFQQVGLPFGTALDAESTGATNRRFTSYDRSAATGLDYAVNRQYDPRQGRFTQVDPLGMGAATLTDPQTLNMYSYAGNDPMNRVDPDGQFFGFLFNLFKGIFQSLRPNTINVSFRYRNLQPIGVSFSPNLRNIGASYGSIGVTVRGNGSWFPDFKALIAELGGGGAGLSEMQHISLASTPCPGSIPESIGKLLNKIAAQEHMDATLLSVTMRHESSFGTDMIPNPRYAGKGKKSHLVGWDMGPMQLGNNVWDKSPFTDGLTNPFGVVASVNSTRKLESFNGNFDENIIVAARAFSLDILPRSKGKDPLNKNADAAGIYRGPYGYQQRYNEYISEAPGDRKQLDCIAGRP